MGRAKESHQEARVYSVMFKPSNGDTGEHSPLEGLIFTVGICNDDANDQLMSANTCVVRFIPQMTNEWKWLQWSVIMTRRRTL
jgi:hypothetical protein